MRDGPLSPTSSPQHRPFELATLRFRLEPAATAEPRTRALWSLSGYERSSRTLETPLTVDATEPPHSLPLDA
jgi:hypothetical protein